jgi:hypothetical protein
LWEDAGPGQPPTLVAQRPFTAPLVQPTANNQLPAVVHCLPTQRPEGVVAITPRGAQFFAKPDAIPGWVFAGMCPTAAAVVIPGRGDEPDRVCLGRENGRLLLLDAGTGALLTDTLLDGAIRRIVPMASGALVVGTAKALLMLDPELNRVASCAFPVEDLAVCESAAGPAVFAISPMGDVAAFGMPPPAP